MCWLSLDLALTALFGNERVVVCTSDLRQSKRGLVRSEGTSLFRFRFGAEGASISSGQGFWRQAQQAQARLLT